MRNLRYILTLVLGTLYLCTWSQDYARLSERTILGTARYVGMGGAMSAIGGDPSSVQDNPAGLGLYRRAEILLTSSVAIDRMRQTGTGNYGARTYFFMPQVSGVISLPTPNIIGKGIQFHNVMFSYNRLHSFNRNYEASAYNSPSLGSLLADRGVPMGIPFGTNATNAGNHLSLTETGYVDQYSFHWAFNCIDQVYVGFGLQVQSYLWSSRAVYTEDFNEKNAEGKNYYNENKSSLVYSGAGCNFTAGVIYRPLRWLRLGVGLQTPSVGSIRMSSAGTFAAQTDSLRYSYAPDQGGPDSHFHQPLRLSTSVAFQVGAYALMALQYNYSYARERESIHSLRAGVEVIPVMGMYINAGYACESSFSKEDRKVPMDPSFDRQDTYYQLPALSQYASLAIGYRGKHMICQLAYQFNWQKPRLFAHENAAMYNDLRTDTHRIVFSIGWHQN